MTYDVILWKSKRSQQMGNGLIALLLSENMECSDLARFPKSATIRLLEQAFADAFDHLPFEISVNGRSMSLGLSHGEEGARHLKIIAGIAQKSGLCLFDFQTQSPSADDQAEFSARVAEFDLSDESYMFSDALALAKSGHAEAMHKLGNCYRSGSGVQQNLDAALEWYQRAATAGLPKALVSLAEVHIQERGSPQDINTGLAYLKQGAERQHAPSMTMLGELLRDGVAGLPPDLVSAVALWHQLLPIDPWVAAFELAKVYESGLCGPPSIDKAVEYFRMARRAGHPEAFRNLRRLGAEP